MSKTTVQKDAPAADDVLPIRREAWRFLPRWERYKAFFQITVFRYLVVWFSVVPLIARLLSEVPKNLKIPIGPTTIDLDLSLPFTWQLLWISSLLFLIAMLLYHARCPAFIKRYNRYPDYIDHGHDLRWLAYETRDLIRTKKGIGEFTQRLKIKKFLTSHPNHEAAHETFPNIEVREKQTSLRYKFNDRIYEIGFPVSEPGVDPEAADKGVFWEVFAAYSGSRAFWRILILIMLVISGIFFILAFLEHIWSGLQMVHVWVQGKIIWPW